MYPFVLVRLVPFCSHGSFNDNSPAAAVGLSKTYQRETSSATNGNEYAAEQLDRRLRNDVKMLGAMLGETIKKHSGTFFRSSLCQTA